MIHAYDPKTYFYIRLGKLLDAWIIDGLVLSFREARELAWRHWITPKITQQNAK
jgi:hypothetical protein